MKVRIWDLPLRLWHWLLVVVVVSLLVTGTLGGNAMVWHFRLGYAVLALLLFRITWGVAGGYWSRFSAFKLHPSSVLAYLRGNDKELSGAGHNPLGSYSVLVLLTLLMAQVGSGLFADDEIFNTGPLVAWVSSETSQWLTAWHKGSGEALILVWIGLHLSAITFYRLWQGRRLVAAMLSGDQELAQPVPASRDTLATRCMAFALFVLCCAAVGLLLSLAP